MPVFVLHVKADLENVDSISFPPSMLWCFDFQASAGDDTRERVTVCSQDEVELVGSRGTANLALRWEGSKHQATASITTVKKVTREQYTADDSGSFVPIIALECRGLEPIKYHPTRGYDVKSTGGALFSDVDLSEKEWCDFDEDNELSVGVYGFEWKIQRA